MCQTMIPVGLLVTVQTRLECYVAPAQGDLQLLLKLKQACCTEPPQLQCFAAVLLDMTLST